MLKRALQLISLMLLLIVCSVYYYVWQYFGSQIKDFTRNSLHSVGKILQYSDVEISGFPFGYNVALNDVVFSSFKAKKLLVSHKFFSEDISVVIPERFSIGTYNYNIFKPNKMNIKLKSSIEKILLSGGESPFLGKFKSMDFSQNDYEIIGPNNEVIDGKEFVLNFEESNNNQFEIYTSSVMSGLFPEIDSSQKSLIKTEMTAQLESGNDGVNKIKVKNLIFEAPGGFSIAVSGSVLADDKDIKLGWLGYKYNLKLAIDKPRKLLEFRALNVDQLKKDKINKLLDFLIQGMPEYAQNKDRIEFEFIYPHKNIIKIGNIDFIKLMKILE